MIADALRGLAALVLHVASREAWRVFDAAVRSDNLEDESRHSAADLWWICARGARAYGWHEEEIEA